MENHLNLTDDEFETAFETCTMSPKLFTHEAHLRLAWIHIEKYGVDQAIDSICTQLLNFVTQLGKRDKYNKTLTVAAIKMVNHFMNLLPTDNFGDFIQEFPRLKYNFKELVGLHYEFDIFNLEEAKSEYLEPDLIPFE